MRLAKRGRGHHGSKRRAAARARTALAVVLAAVAAGVLAPPARALVGTEGTFEYALDAPWRIEPVDVLRGEPIYGAVPINVSIHDAWMIGRDHDNLASPTDIGIGKVCAVVVTERRPFDGDHDPTGPSRTYAFGDLDEIEYTVGHWPEPGDFSIPEHRLCRHWAGEDCAGFEAVTGTSEWHASLAYMPDDPDPGSYLELRIEADLTRRPTDSCDDPSAPGRLTLTNDVRIYLAPEALPRFGPEWLYGDLHYHAQGTDNEGESAYNYRSVARAMGALGLDFAFATEHASNSRQIVDLDLRVGDIFGIEFPPAETVLGLRDMSWTRFGFLRDLLNMPGGVNAEAGLLTSAGPYEPAARRRTTPQIFLGGEVDMIPEMPPGSHYGDLVPWGNGREWSTENLCTGKVDLGLFTIDCDFLGIHLLTHTDTDPDAVLVDDIQGFSVDFGRHHIVYLPKNADRGAFIASNTGHYGGASLRYRDLRAQLEAYGYFFAAHPLSYVDLGDDFLPDWGPNDIPWTDHTYEQVWPSPAFLGLQFWNEDARLTQPIAKWDADTMAPPLPSAGFCAASGTSDAGGHPEYICPVPGDEIGYERHDSHVLGIPKAEVPVEYAQAGFGTGTFRLHVAPAATLIWDDIVHGVEEKLHHGAFTWDRMNHWGLDIRKTLGLGWLPSFLAPRRLYMAGGSDAHGDLNYRRTGYMIRTETVNDDALGKPRNLVDVGAPDGAARDRGPGLEPVAVASQDQVAGAIADGRFSITDGPALRIAVDLDGDGVIDPDEPGMGAQVDLDPERTLPLLVQWKSTAEFGPIDRIDLYVGARSSEVDFGAATHADGRTYAPVFAGVCPRFVFGEPACFPVADGVVEDPPYNRMDDNYWEDPTGQLRFVPENGLDGTKSVLLDLRRFPAMQNRPADRFFVRAFAVTAPAGTNCDQVRERDDCLPRYAFTNPIWAEEKSFLCTAAGLDTEAPAVACNADPTIVRQALPRAFTATAEDVCGATVGVGDVQCYAENADGVRTQRHCRVRTDGGKVTIDRADGNGTIVEWTATATDPAGHVTTATCRTRAENGSAGPRDKAKGVNRVPGVRPVPVVAGR